MRAVLEEGLASFGLDKSCAPVLEQFAGLMLERNRVMNLTAITEPGWRRKPWWTWARARDFRECLWLSPSRLCI